MDNPEDVTALTPRLAALEVQCVYRHPLALADAVHDGKLKRGDLVLLASVGAGFTVGAVLLKWGF